MRLFLLACLFTLPGLIHAGEVFQAARVGQVTIRTLPACTVIEADETGSLEAAWAKGFRLGARYAAFANSSLNTPTVMTFPDWDKKPDASGKAVHVLVQLMLDPLPNLPPVRDEGATLTPMPAMTVACFAQSGAYSAENFTQSLQKIMTYLKARHLAIAGSPRYLYYTDTSWVPNWWRVGEVQVPIVPSAQQN
jgi:hypothetical protein